MKAAQVVRSHDQDEARAPTVIAQIGDGLKRVARADLRLEAKDLDTRMARKRAGSDDTLIE